MNRIASIPKANELAEGERRVCEVDGTPVLLVRMGSEIQALENRCPHRGAPLTGAVLKDGCLQCPWHGLRFEVVSGVCVTNDRIRLRKFVVQENREGIFIESQNRGSEKPVADAVRTALIRYGNTGQVGWFGTIHDYALHRGAHVVVESAIGLQLGEVLLGGDGERIFIPQQRELCGEIVRNVTSEDLSAASMAKECSQRDFESIEARLALLGHSAIEIEYTLDREMLVVWIVSAADAALGPEAVKLAETLGVTQVRFLERQSEDASAASIRYNGGEVLNRSSEKGRVMKGPGLRQKHDLDRIWECPGCQHRERSTGIQTAIACPTCAKNGGSKPTFMKLIASPPTAPRRTFEVFSNTPVPVPVVTILGEDTARIPKKQAMRQGRIEAEKDASPEGETAAENLAAELPAVEEPIPIPPETSEGELNGGAAPPLQ